MIPAWREPVLPEWIDYNGHLNEAYYVLVFSHATDELMDYVGLDAQYRAATDSSLYTVEAHVRYVAEVPDGASLEVRSAIIGSSSKLMRIWHELWLDGRLRATEEVLGLHVTGRRSSPFPPDVAARIQSELTEPPEDAGRAITLG